MKKLMILVLFNLVFASKTKRRKIRHIPDIPITSTSTTHLNASSASYSCPAPPSTSISVSEDSLPVQEVVLSSDNIDFDLILLEEDDKEIIRHSELSIPDNFQFPEDFFGIKSSSSSQYSWDFETELEWTLPLREYRQFVATTVNESAASILDILDKDFFDGRFAFDRVWPGFKQNLIPTELSIGYQKYGLKLLFAEGQDVSVDLLFKYQLINLNRPIYEYSNDLFQSFLSISIGNSKIPIENAKVVIKYSSNFMLNWPSSDGVLPLQAAIERNRLDLVQTLVEAGAEINKVPFCVEINKAPLTEIDKAPLTEIEKAPLTEIEKAPLTEIEKAPLTEIDKVPFTPFMTAIKLRNYDIVEYFLDTDEFDPNVILKDGTNVLVLFARYFTKSFNDYFKKIVKKLTIDAFFQILNSLYDSDNSLCNVLISAVLKEGFHQYVPVIISMGRKAVDKNDITLLNFIQNSGINLKALVFESGFKLIHFAALRGHLRTAQFLIEKGEFIDSLTNEMCTPVQIAYNSGHTTLVKEFIALGASAGLADVLKNAIINDDIEIFETLILHRNNLNIFIFSNGFNLITWSIAQDRPKILELLFNSNKIDLKVNDQNGKTIFNFAAPENSSLELALTIDYVINLFLSSKKTVAK